MLITGVFLCLLNPGFGYPGFQDILERGSASQPGTPGTLGWMEYLEQDSENWGWIGSELVGVGLEGSHTEPEAMLIIGGSKTERDIVVVTETNIAETCLPTFPSIRFAHTGCRVGSSILVCGGRKDLLGLNDECWMYDQEKNSWEEFPGLPFPVAGASSVCYPDTVYVLGGVLEQDYYQDEVGENEDFYDYFTEVTSDFIIELNVSSKEWSVKERLPRSIHGACSLIHRQYIIITGGRNQSTCNHGYRHVSLFDTVTREWSEGPELQVGRYYHGCSIVSRDGEPGILVAGGVGYDNHGDSVEFLSLLDGDIGEEWEPWKPLRYPHPNQPSLHQLGDRIVLYGGGGFPYPGGENKAEVFKDGEWKTLKTRGEERSYGLRIFVPEPWVEKCKMEPNLGPYSYHRKKGQEYLKNKVWFCSGSSFTAEKTIDDQSLSCTVPGCQYSEVHPSLTRRGGYTCTVGQDSVNCTVSCVQGYVPHDGQVSVACTRGEGFKNRYLECVPDSV